ELVINALKHAFPEGSSGRIWTRFGLNDGAPLLVVEDDGKGLPADAGAPETGLGAMIIRQLAAQFGGEPRYEAREGGGTRVVLPLPKLDIDRDRTAGWAGTPPACRGLGNGRVVPRTEASMRLIGILNRDGGTFRTIDIPGFIQRSAATFARHGHVFEARIVSGSGLLAELERAAADPGTDVVLAGGGDGTIAAAAGVCFRAGKPLAVLPAGTMNFFARSLRVPADLDEAVEAIAAGRRFDVDIATANGRP